MIDPVFELPLRLALSLLFGRAAWHKLSDWSRFEATIRDYALLPASMGLGVARALPLVEGGIALGLLFPGTRAVAAVAGISILLLYTGAIGVNLARGRRDIDCGCFGSSARAPLSFMLVMRNVALFAATTMMLWPIRERGLIWVDWLTIAATLIALALLGSAGQRLAEAGPALKRLGGHR